MQNFPKVYDLKIVFEDNSLRLIVTVVFKKRVLRKRKCSYPFQSICDNNVVVVKQIYFSPTFLKS